MDRRTEIEERLSAIKAECETENADLDALLEESRSLNAELAEIKEKEEKRSELLENVIETGKEVRTFKGEEPMTEERTFGIESAEYRSAFLKDMRGLELTEVEQRALDSTTGSAGYAIPTMTQNKIITKVKEYAPLLNEIELLAIPGYVTIPAEGTTTDAKIHKEGATIKADAEVLNQVKLGMYEITKLVTVSKTVELMSIDAFEAWLTDMIARKVADKITGYILLGTGSSEPQGVNAISWSGTNSIEVANKVAMTEKDIDSAVALLNGSYDTGAKWVMSKKTFFTDFRPLQDNSKNRVIYQEGNTWFVDGYPVIRDDRMTEHEAILGNFKLGYVGNLPENATITSEFVVRENAYDFLGTAMFDGKVQATEAFVKIKKALA